jgi:tetratricopeptide (TPR) repeat protein
MSPRRLRVEKALAVLPDVEELAPLRDALIGSSSTDSDRAWAGSREYDTLDKRLADLSALAVQIPELAAQVQERAEQRFRHVAAMLEAYEAGDLAAAARELVAAGEIEEGERRLQQAERFYAKALELGRKPRDRSTEGLALRRLARVARAKGELDRALDLYGRSYKIAEAQRDVEGAVVACQGIGNVCIDQGRWAEAREWYQTGLTLVPPDPSSRLLWQLYNNLSVVELRTGALEASRNWLERAAEIASALGDEQARVVIENGRGRLLLALGEIEEAEAAYRRGLGGVAAAFSRATLHGNLAEALVLQGRWSEAEGHARQAEEIAITHRIFLVLPEIYRTLGSIAQARHDEDGFLFYEQALDLCRDHELPALELALTQHRYGLWEAELGRWEAAIARLREAENIYARLSARAELQAVEEDLARVEAQYASERSGTLAGHKKGVT